MRKRHATGGLIAAALALLAPAAFALSWRSGAPCEPPAVFYSTAHDPNVPLPCCPRPAQRCPGGVACVGPNCADPYGQVACAPTADTDRPNIILFVADDQGYCFYGFMGPACRTSTTGTAIPVPATPNLDGLALQPANGGRGRVFAVAYDGAPWSIPAREVLQTGELLKDLLDPNVATQFLAHRLAEPGGPVYCSFAAGGKLGKTGPAETGYHAATGHGIGRTRCASAPCAPNCDDPPRCGADIPGGVNSSLADTFAFIDAMMLGPRTNGALDPSVTYTMAEPFFMWFGTDLPHVGHNPPAVIETVPHPPMPTDYLFGPSVAHPGQPRFPFGDIRYAAAFDRDARELALPGLYGMVWWEDDSVHQLRQHLEGIKVWDATGTTAVTLWDRTVFMFMADNGADLPHAKYSFTENGFRSPIVVYDASRPPSAAEPRVDLELAAAVDIAPTVLDYAGRPIPPLPGVSLKPYVDGTPPAAPLRNTVCGHQVRGSSAIHVRFIRTRPGTVGRCAPAAGGACTSDADCAGGVCLLGACATGQLCLEDDDCPGGETCGARAQKWCRFGHHPVNEASVPPPDQQPTVACDVDADCVAGCPSADPIYCTCEYRAVKLYVRADASLKLMDVFVDPDERGLARYFGAPPPGDLSIGPGAPAHHLAQRLACCLDHWWVPPGQLGDPGCTSCEPTYECHRCGDGVADASEACDGANLRGASCTTIPGGFSGGTLACTPSCTLDTSGCTL